MSREVLKRVALTQLLIFGGLYLVCLASFVWIAEGITERFAAMARGPYLATVIWGQLRLLPAYGALTAIATALTAPLVIRLGAPASRLSLAVEVLLLDLGLAVLASGLVLKGGPGLVDTVARKLPAFDLYALYRWHVLDGLSVLFVALVLFAIASAGRRLGALVVVAMLLGATSLYRAAPPRAVTVGKPNVLIIATDSWRFDHVGVHGAKHADLTPNIDAFSKQAIDLTNLHVATASTLESWVTFFTGQLPSTHGIRSMYPSRTEVAAVDTMSATVPRLLNAAGYDTFVSDRKSVV